MKSLIIRINDVADIDTSKISVYDLNNRYIDSQGNMYGLKYNKSLRKIDVIKIVRTHEKNAATYQQMIIQKRRDIAESAVNGDGAGPAAEGPPEEPEDRFNPDIFIEKTLELTTTHRERIRGIIMNIRNSNIVSKDNKTDSSQLEDIFRNLEIDGIQGADNLINYQKELASYHRSLSYYQAKMDDRAREIIEKLASDNRKVIKFIYHAEILENMRLLYRNIDRNIKHLKTFLEEKNPDEVKWITPYERQSFKDGMISINTTISEVDRLMGDLTLLEEYAFTIDNY